MRDRRMGVGVRQERRDERGKDKREKAVKDSVM